MRISRLCLPAAAALALLILPGAVHAEAPADRQLSVTISPLHLAFPAIEVTGEYSLHPKFAPAIILGVGKVDEVNVVEIGAQGQTYLVGDFDHGMQLGVEALYVHASADDVDSSSVSATAQGLAIGPYVGYKFIADVGFTFNAQLGVQYVTARGEAESDTESASASDSNIVPLLNLNIGWSF